MVISEREEVVLALTNTPIQTQFVRGKANVISACMRRFREKRFPFCVAEQYYNCSIVLFNPAMLRLAYLPL